MSEAVFNPYAADQMPEGGGLTRDIVVVSAQYIREPINYKDPETGEQSYFTGLRIMGMSTDPKAEGKVAKYDYSSGRKSKPSPDGEMLLDENGKPAKVYKTSNLGRAIEGLRQGGLEAEILYPRISALVGAKITLAGFDQKKKDGTIKTYKGTDGKQHNSIEWFPEKYNGGAGLKTGNGAGNGVAADAVTEKADAAVLAAITAAGGSIERKDLIRAIATNLKGDADAVKVASLVARADFNAGKGWKADGSTFTVQA